MVDYVNKVKKKFKENKVFAVFIVAIIVIIGIASFLGALKVISDFFSPTTNLGIKLYDFIIFPTYNENKTAWIGLNTTFPAQITNTGKIPVHIVACDVFMLPVGELEEQHPSEIKYLKPQESFSYNFTKYFDVSMPLDEGIYASQLNNFTLLVMYTDDLSSDFKSVWTNIPDIFPID